MSTEQPTVHIVAPLDYFGHKSLKEIAQHSGLSVRTVKNLIAREIDPLPCYRVTGRVTVRPCEYDAWARQHRALGNTIEAQVQRFQIRSKVKKLKPRRLVRRVA